MKDLLRLSLDCIDVCTSEPIRRFVELQSQATQREEVVVYHTHLGFLNARM